MQLLTHSICLCEIALAPSLDENDILFKQGVELCRILRGILAGQTSFFVVDVNNVQKQNEFERRGELTF